MFLVDMVRRLIEKGRVCPVCGHRQTPRQDGQSPVRCEKCGAELPPKAQGAGPGR